MIYPEFRAHSIAFGTRHVLSCIMFWFGYDEPLPHYALCFATMIAADKISTRFTETNKQTTMRNMPLDDTIDEATQQANKLQQSKCQITANMISCYTINSSFMPLMAIQGAAFMMTLTRKSLITSLTWHRAYNVMLWICLAHMFDPSVQSHMWVANMISYFMYTRVFFKHRTNKYLNWMCVFVVHEICRHCVTYDWNGWCQHIIAILITAYFIRKNSKRISSIMW